MLFAWGALAFAQTPPAFEVASVKPADPQPMGKMMISMGCDKQRCTYTNINLKILLSQAYKVKQSQISGPAWLDSERFDVLAKIPDGVSETQVPAMLQALLEERFQMKLHKETRDTSIYALLVGKGGPKMEKAADLPDSPAGSGERPALASPAMGGAMGGRGSVSTSTQGAAPPPPPPPGAGGGAGMGGRGAMPRGGFGISMNGATGKATFEMNGSTMARFADTLSDLVGRPVVDMTELKGDYKFKMEVAAEDLAGMKMGMAAAGAPPAHQSYAADGPAPEVTPAPSLFSAVQDLGLRLESRKAPFEYLVIDHAEKVPTEN